MAISKKGDLKEQYPNLTSLIEHTEKVYNIENEKRYVRQQLTQEYLSKYAANQLAWQMSSLIRQIQEGKGSVPDLKGPEGLTMEALLKYGDQFQKRAKRGKLDPNNYITDQFNFTKEASEWLLFGNEAMPTIAEMSLEHTLRALNQMMTINRNTFSRSRSMFTHPTNAERIKEAIGYIIDGKEQELKGLLKTNKTSKEFVKHIQSFKFAYEVLGSDKVKEMMSNQGEITSFDQENINDFIFQKLLLSSPSSSTSG